MNVALYVPGSRPDRFDKAAATGAEVILDLEDSVAPADRPTARAHIAAWLARHRGPVQVRVNAPGSADQAADLAALPPHVAVRVPKVSGPGDLAGLWDRPVHVLVESALGVERAFDLSRVPGVVSIGLGEADLAAELGLEDEQAFAWIRSRVVVAAAAAGLPAPLMSAYPVLDDLDGLAASCRRGRALGMWGRAAVHPRQVAVIREVFSATEGERVWARDVLAAVDDSGGVGRAQDGSMIDAAMARRARRLLARE